MSTTMCRPVSLVKYVSPDCIVLDLFRSCPELATSCEQRRLNRQKLSAHWRVHENDPLDGDRFGIGEVVAAKRGTSWSPAMVIDSRIERGLCYYDLVILDSGEVTITHRMNIRALPDFIKVPRRYMVFSFADILPVTNNKSRFETWSVDACNDLRLIFKIATKMEMEVVATRKTGSGENYERLYGNLHIQIANNTVDVKSWLIEKEAGYIDRKRFQHVHGLKEDNYIHYKVKEPLSVNFWNKDAPSSAPKIIQEPVQVPAITDENLDEHLHPSWRKGGGEPISQQRRDRLRKLLIDESYISFAPCKSVSKHEEAEAATSANSIQCIDKESNGVLQSVPSTSNQFLREFEAENINPRSEISFAEPPSKSVYGSGARSRNTEKHRQKLYGVDETVPPSSSEPNPGFQSEKMAERPVNKPQRFYYALPSETESEEENERTVRGRGKKSHSFNETVPPASSEPNPEFESEKMAERPVNKPQRFYYALPSETESEEEDERTVRGRGKKSHSFNESVPSTSNQFLREFEAKNINPRSEITFTQPPSKSKYGTGAVRNRNIEKHRQKLYGVDETVPPASSEPNPEFESEKMTERPVNKPQRFYYALPSETESEEENERTVRGRGKKSHSFNEDQTLKAEFLQNEAQPELSSLENRISGDECDTMKEDEERLARGRQLCFPRASLTPAQQAHHVQVVSEDAQKLLAALFK